MASPPAFSPRPHPLSDFTVDLGFSRTLLVRWHGAGLGGFSRSRISLPALKTSAPLAETDTGAPVFGLRPFRAWRSRTVNDPNPRSSTRFPAAKASEIRSKMASTSFSQSLS